MAEPHRIVAITTTAPGVARVLFASGDLRQISWADFAADGPVFAKLANPAYSDNFQLIHSGFAVRWPDGMDWDAGAVFNASQPRPAA